MLSSGETSRRGVLGTRKNVVARLQRPIERWRGAVSENLARNCLIVAQGKVVAPLHLAEGAARQRSFLSCRRASIKKVRNGSEKLSRRKWLFQHVRFGTPREVQSAAAAPLI
jgi:hypothetical protein